MNGGSVNPLPRERCGRLDPSARIRPQDDNVIKQIHTTRAAA
jgi:hypothetical protein